jgi:sugar lactone lactonase YvrE
VDAFGNLFIADTYNNRIRKAFIQGPTLQLNNMSSNTAGGYDVIVTGANGSVTSSVATVTVLLPPSITAQPQAVAAVGGSDVSLTVAVAGTAPFGYQWQFDGTNLVDNGQITGSQTNALSLSSIDLTDQGSYEVIVTNAYGSVTSSVATLTLLLPPSITTQPQGGTATNGSNVALTVAVSGTAPFTYQWRQNGANLPTVITTVAGNGASGYAGDNGPATNASLTYATSVAVDASGNLFIGDAGNCHIRKVRTNGIISTVAGNGSDFYSGDGGAATGAGLDPYCVVVDASGNLFVADMFNNRVRKIGTNGTISTVAGAGTQGFSGDGGAATSAKLRFPWCAALDASGNLFIADSGNNRIRKVTNGIINTVAGNGTNGCSGDGGLATNAALGNPEGVTVDALGNLFIADFNNNRIRKVGTNGIITTVAGGGIDYPGDGGAATNASLCNPSGVAVDAFGNLFIADGGDNRIREVTTNGVITTVAGGGIHIPGDGGAATGAALYAPSGVSVDAAGDLFIADTGNNRIREVPIPGPTLALHGVTAGNDGSYDVIVSNAYGCVTSDVAVLTVQGPPPSISVQPQDGLAVVGGTFTLTVAVSGPGPFTCQWQGNGVNLPSLITTVAGGGTNNFGDGGAATNASLLQPFGAAVDAFGNLFIADRNRNNIRKVGTNGIINTVAGSAVGVVGYLGDGSPAIAALLALPCGVAVDPYGNLFIADTFFSHIRKVSNVSPYDISTVAGVAGKITNGYSGDGVAATNTPLNGPYDVVLDASGSLLIADTFNHRIRRVPNNGLIFTVAGIGTNSYSGDGGPATNAAINTPCGVAADALGNFFIADTSNNCVRVVDTNGIITTVAGTGTPGFSGDGGAATNASLALPQGVAVDAFGNLFIADTGNNCIRVVDGNGIITTVAGNGTNGFSGDGGAATNASLDLPSRVAVDAYGNLFIADLANRRIRKVSIQTPILQLSQIAAGSAGVYDLVVSNAYGAVTSAVVTLTVALPPFSAGLSAGQGVQFQFSGTANSSYVLQAATDLTPPVNWQPLVTNAADTNGNWTFTDTNTAANTARFYRLASP